MGREPVTTAAQRATSGGGCRAETPYASVVLPFVSGPTKLVDGPFFVTDVFTGNTGSFDMVTGGDCSVPSSQHTIVLTVFNTGGGNQVHEIRLPVRAGQALCTSTVATVLGFRPY